MKPCIGSLSNTALPSTSSSPPTSSWPSIFELPFVSILPKEPVDVKEPETSVVSNVVVVKVVTFKAGDSTSPKEPVPSV